MEKVLVTGGAGFIGSHTVDLFLKKGCYVAVVDNFYSGNRENLNSKADFFECDVTNKKDLEKVFEKARPDYVLHLAAQTNARLSFKEPVFDVVTNVGGSINVLECCRKFGVKKVVFASSAAVYGEPKELPVNEASRKAPLCPYGISKFSAESYFAQYNAIFGLDYTILRYGNVFGPRQDPKGEAGVVSVFIENMLQGKQVKINGDGEQTRDFVFVGDVANANRLALEKNAKSRIFNIALGEKSSVNELFSYLKESTGFKQEPIHGREIVGEIKHISLNSNLAGKEIGWLPKTSFKEGLEKTVEWAKSHHS